MLICEESQNNELFQFHYVSWCKSYAVTVFESELLSVYVFNLVWIFLFFFVLFVEPTALSRKTNMMID